MNGQTLAGVEEGLLLLLLLRSRKHTHGRRLFYHKMRWKIFNPSNVHGIKTSVLAPKLDSLMISVFAGLVGAGRAINRVKWSQSRHAGPDRKTSVWSRHQSQCIITHGTS